MDDLNYYLKDKEANVEKGKIKLNYDYETYENILNNSKKEDIVSSKEEEINNNEIIIPFNQKNILNSNFKNKKIPNSKSNEGKNKSFNYIPNISQFTQQTTDILNRTENKNMILFNNLKKELKLNYNDNMKTNELKIKEIDDNKKINNHRNNSINYSKIKVIPKLNKAHLFEEDDNNENNNIYKNNLYEEKDFQDPENGKIDKKLFKTEYNTINKNKVNKDSKNFYSTFNQLSDYLKTGNEEVHKINEINDIISEDSKPIKVNAKSLDNKRVTNHKSTPHLNSNLYSELYNYSKAFKNNEKIKNRLILENNKLEKEKNDVVSKYKILKAKSELIVKDNFIIKTKYEVNKNNLKLLQKKLEEKNYDIEQMKKVLLSNNQQINFLTTLKDSNIKTAKDNEELIQSLKETISNLNKIIEEDNNKIAFLKKQSQNEKIQKLKKENEYLKMYVNEREKTICTLKSLISIYTQNLENILNNNNDITDIKIEANEDDEILINECEKKIKEFKKKIDNMQKKMNEILQENIDKEKEKNELKMKIDKNLEIMKKMQNESDLLNKRGEEMSVKIEEYKNKIKEKEIEFEKKVKECKEFKIEIENKNNEIEEIKNEIEKNREEIEKNKKEIEKWKNEIEIKNKEISEKIKEIEDKNQIIEDKEKEIQEKKIEIENKNKEINEKQGLLDMKNKELEEKSKEIDLQIIQKANLDFFEKVKKFEIDIKNKDKQIEDLKNNIIINKNITSNKNEENKEIIFENKISYTEIPKEEEIKKNNENKNKENKNIKTECNNINYLTKKILFENKNEKENENSYNYKDKINLGTNFDYNNYFQNEEEFSDEVPKKESYRNENDNKRKIIIKKESNNNNKSYNLNSQNEKFTISFRDNISNIIDNKNKENSQNYKTKNNSKEQYNLNYNYLKTENNKTINIKKIENTKNNKIPSNNIVKESKVKTNSKNINNIEKIKYNNFENKNNVSNNLLKLELINNNEEDINTKQFNQLKQFNNNDDISNNNNYINSNKNINYPNDKNIEITSTNLQASSSMSFSQNEDIKLVNYKENKNNQSNYIYSLIGQDLISFDLKEKKFEIITVRDDTNGIFSSYISFYHENKLYPLMLNTIEGFYILLHKYIFYYDQINNSICILIKLISHHTSGGFIYIKNELYSISGNNTTQCEKYSLLSNKNILLPNTNFPRVNSGICNVNNEYIYIFFGKANINSIERLYIGNNINYNYNDNWEIVRINQNIGINDGNICLDKFVTFLDDFNNIIIFGGEECKGSENKNIYGFNLSNNSISIIGKIDSCSLYCTQYIMLDESIFSIYDMNNGLHFFNKELDYHEIFNLNV